MTEEASAQHPEPCSSTEARLLESERRYRSLSEEFQAVLDAIPDTLVLQSPDLRVIWANKGAAAGLGKRLEEIEGEHCFRLWHLRGEPCVPCPVQKSFATGEAHTEQVTSPDGEIWELRSVPVKDAAGRVTKVVEVARKISEQVRLQTELLRAQKLESVGRLAGGVAHDFNNIIAAVVGCGNLLQMQLGPDDPRRELADQILAATERAAALTRSLLAFSRPQVASLGAVELNGLVERTRAFLTRIIGEDVEVVTRLADSPLVVMTDPLQIEQVLVNLATNARDAMPGGGTLVIATRREVLDDGAAQAAGGLAPGPHAAIAVTDSGHGMDAQTQARIFEPFYTTKEVGRGTGLGMSIVHEIVRRHGGAVSVSSEPGSGTTVLVLLPLHHGPAEPLPAAAGGAGNGLRGEGLILLVEDDPAVRRVTRQVLERFGYGVVEAANGAEGLEQLWRHRGRVRLALLDVVMPRKNGRELYEEARVIDPALKFLFTSGYPSEILGPLLLAAEGVRFLPKPAPADRLLREIRDLLGGATAP